MFPLSDMVKELMHNPIFLARKSKNRHKGRSTGRTESAGHSLSADHSA